MISAMIEGGWVMKTVVTELSDEEETALNEGQQDTNEPDEEATVISEKKPK